MSQIREKVKEEDTKIKSKSAHHSQSDSAKGYGGTYGVQKDRQDKVGCLVHRNAVVPHTVAELVIVYSTLSGGPLQSS